MASDAENDRIHHPKAKPHHGHNGLNDEAARDLSSSQGRQHYAQPQFDYAGRQAEYDRAGVNVHITRPGETWESIASDSLRKQHRPEDVRDPDKVRQEVARIMWETQKWKNAMIKDPAQRDMTPHTFALEHPMLLYMGDTASAQAGQPPADRTAAALAPGTPRPITPESLPTFFRHGKSDDSQAPIQSKAFGSDYGAIGMYHVTGKETWPQIAAMSLRWQNKPELANNPDAIKHEIARIMYATEQWKVSSITDPTKRQFTPHAFALQKDMLLCLWDQTISPDQFHPNAFWHAPVQAPANATTMLGYRDRGYVGRDATGIFLPGSTGAVAPGGKAFVMEGADVHVVTRGQEHPGITIVNDGGTVEVPADARGVLLQDVRRSNGT